MVLCPGMRNPPLFVGVCLLLPALPAVSFIPNPLYGSFMNREISPSVVNRDVLVFASDGGHKVRWSLAAEVPVSLGYNGVAHVVMMASPSDLEDFAVGFSLSERILHDPGDIESLEVRRADRGYLIDMRIGEAAAARVATRRRNLPGQSSCGICGIIEIEQALPALPKIIAVPDVTRGAVAKALSSLRDHQPFNASARSLHGAAFADTSGTILAAREDIGRHNALDKLIGAAARGEIDLATGMVVLSSRCSVELVQKAAIAGVPVLATVSAPTTLAVELAEGAGMALVTGSQPEDITIICDPHNILT